MTKHERERICTAIGMLEALEYVIKEEGAANATADAKTVLVDLLEEDDDKNKVE